MPRVARPKNDEPIREVRTASGTRYKVVLDVSKRGEPRKQSQRTFATLEDARDYVHTVRKQRKAGTLTVASKVTVRELAAQWIASRTGLKEVSRNGYRDALTPILDRIGDRPAQSITLPEVERVMALLESEGGRRGRPLSHRSRSYALTALRQVFRYGVRTGALTSNPAEYAEVGRNVKGREEPDRWEPGELSAFVAHTDDDPEEWVRAAFRLTACGLRRSEVLGLHWSSVDLDAGTIRVEASLVKVGRGNATDLERKGKSDASERTVPVETMHPGTVAALRALRARQAADRLALGASYGQRAEDPLVVVDALGQSIHPDAYSWRFAALTAAAGLRPIRLHQIRHTLALILHRGAVPPADAASLLGHTVATHLQFYLTRGTEDGAASAAARLGELMAGNG